MKARWRFGAFIGVPFAFAHGQQGVPVHPMGRIVATTREPIHGLNGIRVLSDGRVLINDVGGHRLLLFDSTLATFTTIIDSGAASSHRYPATGLPAIIPYAGDTTIFYDPIATAMLVVDPAGAIVRVISAPFPPDASYLSSSFGGFQFPRFDGARRLIYRASMSTNSRPLPGGGTRGGFPTDSVPIVRAAFGAVAPDTLAYIRVAPRDSTAPFLTPEGATIRQRIANPIVVFDDWTVTTDGTLAIARGQDYHIDWVSPDGARSASPKLPFLWHALSDSEKVAIVDSLRAVALAHPGSYGAQVNGVMVTGKSYPDFIAPADLPSYRAPFPPFSMRADAEGNVWIHTTPEVPLAPGPGPVYDVINRAGKLIDRVQVTPGLDIVGFSPGYIYMSSREGTGTVVVRVHIR